MTSRPPPGHRGQSTTLPIESQPPGPDSANRSPATPCQSTKASKTRRPVKSGPGTGWRPVGGSRYWFLQSPDPLIPQNFHDRLTLQLSQLDQTHSWTGVKGHSPCLKVLEVWVHLFQERTDEKLDRWTTNIVDFEGIHLFQEGSKSRLQSLRICRTGEQACVRVLSPVQLQKKSEFATSIGTKNGFLYLKGRTETSNIIKPSPIPSSNPHPPLTAENTPPTPSTRRAFHQQVELLRCARRPRQGLGLRVEVEPLRELSTWVFTVRSAYAAQPGQRWGSVPMAGLRTSCIGCPYGVRANCFGRCGC